MRSARLRAGLSQAVLAQQAGVTQATVSLAERGADLRLSTFTQLAAALDLVPQLVPRKVLALVREVIASVP
ncbi:MAG: helix-turn-helix transcriptional regulator [Vulcanimicrobiaceae bacterium]